MINRCKYWGKINVYDVLIIGGGVTGCAIARQLSRFDLKLAVLDGAADVAMGASRANSAIVHAGYDCVPGTKMARLNVRGNELFDALCRELNVPLKRTGSLVLAFSEQDMQAVQRLYDYGVKNKVPGVRILSAQEAHAMQKGLNPAVCGALYAPTGGITCPYELTCALAKNAMDNGVDFFLGSPVVKINTLDDELEVETANGVLLRSRYVVNAAGLYADEVSAMAGDNSVHIHARKGEYILFDRAVSDFVQMVLFQAPTAKGKGVLVSPTVDDNAFIGPTAVDQDDKEDTSVRPEAIDELKNTASLSMPELPMGRPITLFAGLRAIAEGGDFIIERSKANPRLIQAAGISSPGLSSAPAIAEEVQKILAGCGVELIEKPDYNPVRPHKKRFRHMSAQERAEAIRENPAYGRIICRCETVPEAEIVEAIREMPGIPSVDAIKRRTRAGMGRCQGGFCMPRVMELIEREKGIPMEQITKNGGASRICVGSTRGEGQA